MNLEHLALNVTDPLAAADWYCKHLGLRIVSSSAGDPPSAFVADTNGMMIELYRRDETPILPFETLEPLTLHIALATSDAERSRQALIAAGCSPVGEIEKTPRGDRLAFVRDPWGVVLQLAQRAAAIGRGA
jgi:catechol 2,3-dioxygenase-like lactoylglutathione lyase family enzyme